MYFTEDVQTANTFTTHALLRLQALNANDTVQCAIRTTSAGTPTISVLAIRAFTGMWWL